MFEKNLLSYDTSGDIGVCPICNEKLVATVIKTTGRRNIDVSCIKCKKSEFYLGVYEE